MSSGPPGRIPAGLIDESVGMWKSFASEDEDSGCVARASSLSEKAIFKECSFKHQHLCGIHFSLQAELALLWEVI